MERLWDKVRRDLLAAWAYGKEAARVLGRCRGLVLIPIAIALFNAVESEGGRYLAATQTAFGRAGYARVRESAPPGNHHYIDGNLSLQGAYWSAKQQAFERGVHRLASEGFLLSFAGTEMLVGQAASVPGEQAFTPTNVGLAYLVGLLGLLVGAPIAAGYLKRLDRTVVGEAPAGVFWADARTYAWPVLLYFVVAGLVALPWLGILGLAAIQHRGDFATSNFWLTWYFWVAPLLLLFVCLMPMGVGSRRAVPPGSRAESSSGVEALPDDARASRRSGSAVPRPLHSVLLRAGPDSSGFGRPQPSHASVRGGFQCPAGGDRRLGYARAFCLVPRGHDGHARGW